MYRFSTSFNPPENQRMHDHRQEIQREKKIELLWSLILVISSKSSVTLA